jgi:hypothetical protein
MLGKLTELAERCEREAANWIGQPMHDGLLDIATRIREHARTQATAPAPEGSAACTTPPPAGTS